MKRRSVVAMLAASAMLPVTHALAEDSSSSPDPLVVAWCDAMNQQNPDLFDLCIHPDLVFEYETDAALPGRDAYKQRRMDEWTQATSRSATYKVMESARVGDIIHARVETTIEWNDTSIPYPELFWARVQDDLMVTLIRLRDERYVEERIRKFSD